MAELSHIQLAVDDHDAFASAEKYGTQVAVGVQRVQLGLTDAFGILRKLGTGMHILALLTAGGDQIFQNVYQILLQVLQPVVRQIEGALLGHNGAGCVVGVYHADAVLNTGIRNDLLHLIGDLMESGVQAGGTGMDGVSVNFHS